MDSELLAELFGYFSIGCWIVVFTPQFYENYKRKNTDGVSVSFLTFWIVGDILNLIGIILENLLFTMLLLAVYYLFADVVLFSQIIYYRKKNSKHIDENVNVNDPTIASYGTTSTSEHTPLLDSKSTHDTRHAIKVFYILSFTIWSALLLGSAFFFFGSDQKVDFSQLHLISQLLGWGSAVLYCVSRIPQIMQNFRNQSCEGLSLVMFIFSVVGNVTYCVSIVLKSTDPTYLLINYPWLLGSGGTLFFDFTIFFQFYMYRQPADKEYKHDIEN